MRAPLIAGPQARDSSRCAGPALRALLSVRRFSFGRGAVIAAALVGNAVAGGPTIQLTARLTSPHEVQLEWSDGDATAAGHIVEFINRSDDEWVILGFLPPGQCGFVHPRLAPDTPYSYRVRAFHGPTSAPVSVTVAEGLSDRAYAAAYALPEDYTWAPPRHLAVVNNARHRPGSIRLPGKTAISGAPTDFKAELIKATVSGFRLTWSDQSSDEEGFLLERIDAAAGFVVCAVIPRDMNSFGWALEPPQRRATFRLRAFYFGPPSAITSVVTGPESPPRPITARVTR